MSEIPGNSPDIKPNKFSTKDFYNTVVWILTFYFKNFPLRTSALIITQSIQDFSGLAYAFMVGKIIDSIIRTIQSGSASMDDIYYYLGILLIYYILMGSVVFTIRTYSSRTLRRLGDVKLEQVFYQHLNYLGIQNLENPEFVDVVNRSREWLDSCYDVIIEISIFISSIIRFILATLTIISFFPIMIPVMILFTVLKFLPERYYNKLDFRWQTDNTEGKRIAHKSAGLLQDPKTLHEVSVVNAYGYFDNLYQSYFSWYMDGLHNIVKKQSWANFLMGSLDSFVAVIAYAMIFKNAIAGVITIGTVSFQMRAVDILSQAVERILDSFTWMSEFSLKMNDIVKLFNAVPAVQDGEVSLGKLKGPPDIEFKNVSFKYPNSDKFIFKNLNLVINSGEKVAIVGHNGAGKTTLIKLIARFYEVTEGQILINGKDINELKIASWYKNVGILFQEYNFYSHLTVKNNIYAGDTSKPIDEEKIIEAAKNADAHEFITEYKYGYDQLMSEQYKNGIRPSTGQQQKIAIARFFYRNAPLAIFDEPTAAIDAVSEYKIFNKIYDFFKNKTVVIISHRFSTVRNADRIIVMEHGQIVEQGTHEELLAKSGVYSQAFHLQAEGYQK